MNELLILAMKELPGVVDLIKARHAEANPALPPLTDAEVIAALRSAIDSSEAKDDLWLSVHPN